MEYFSSEQDHIALCVLDTRHWFKDVAIPSIDNQYSSFSAVLKNLFFQTWNSPFNGSRVGEWYIRSGFDVKFKHSDDEIFAKLRLRWVIPDGTFRVKNGIRERQIRGLTSNLA